MRSPSGFSPVAIDDRLGELVGVPRAVESFDCYALTLAARTGPPSITNASAHSASCLGRMSSKRSFIIPRVCQRHRPFASPSGRHNQIDPLPKMNAGRVSWRMPSPKQMEKLVGQAARKWAPTAMDREPVLPVDHGDALRAPAPMAFSSANSGFQKSHVTRHAYPAGAATARSRYRPPTRSVSMAVTRSGGGRAETPGRYVPTNAPAATKTTGAGPILWRKRHKQFERSTVISGGCLMPRYSRNKPSIPSANRIASWLKSSAPTSRRPSAATAGDLPSRGHHEDAQPGPEAPADRTQAPQRRQPWIKRGTLARAVNRYPAAVGGADDDARGGGHTLGREEARGHTASGYGVASGYPCRTPEAERWYGGWQWPEWPVAIERIRQLRR